MLSLMVRLRLVPILCSFALLWPTAARADDVAEKVAAAAEKEAHEHVAHNEPSAMDHVMDSDYLHILDNPESFGLPAVLGHLPLPNIFGFQITKFMFLEALAALLIVIIYVPIARRLARGETPHGAWDNAFEVLLSFVRDQIAKPNLGEEQADRYVPFLWTLFLFVLFNNLLGMFPYLGSATASIYVTGALALVVFFAIHGSAIIAMGTSEDHGHGHDDSHGHHVHDSHDHAHGPAPSPATVFQRGSVRYVQSLWPHIDVPFPMGLMIKPLVFVIEVVGLLVRNAVLAVRLFANMFAGHMVLATILLFIKMAANVSPVLWGTITLSSVLGIVALSLLELFVAFLQAYIFTFLTSLFMGMAITPQH
jgi:F-type H+-transporting ATPase subunit a